MPSNSLGSTSDPGALRGAYLVRVLDVPFVDMPWDEMHCRVAFRTKTNSSVWDAGRFFPKPDVPFGSFDITYVNVAPARISTIDVIEYLKVKQKCDLTPANPYLLASAKLHTPDLTELLGDDALGVIAAEKAWNGVEEVVWSLSIHKDLASRAHLLPAKLSMRSQTWFAFTNSHWATRKRRRYPLR